MGVSLRFGFRGLNCSGKAGEALTGDFRRTMQFMTRLPIVAALLLAGTSTVLAAQMPVFANPQPLFDPMKFFTGRTRSWGVFENRQGQPTERIRTETWGRVVNHELQMEQDLYLGTQPRQHRSWRMHRVDAHHYQATANDMVGSALGEAWGNTFCWSVTLATKPGDPLFNIRMTQRMYLQPDGRTMINRDVMQKFGITIAEVTEEFHHL